MNRTVIPGGMFHVVFEIDEPVGPEQLDVGHDLRNGSERCDAAVSQDQRAGAEGLTNLRRTSNLQKLVTKTTKRCLLSRLPAWPILPPGRR